MSETGKMVALVFFSLFPPFLRREGDLPLTRGCSSSAEHLASNQEMAVRFRPAAPPNGFSDFLFGSFLVNMPRA